MDGLDFREINGWVYTRLVPLGGKDRKAPPKWLFWLLARTVPEMRRRIKVNKEAFRTDLMGRLVDQWHEEWKPDQISTIEAQKKLDLGSLSDSELADHWSKMHGWFELSLDRHFWLAMPMQSVAELAFFCEDNLDMAGRDVTRLFAGLSATSTEPGRELAKLAAMARANEAVRSLVEKGGKESVESLSETDVEFAKAFDQYQQDFGCRALRYELADPSLAEIPELTLSLIRDQLSRDYDPAVEVAAATSAREAAREEARSALERDPDVLAEFERLLIRAEKYYPVREDNEFYTVSAPMHFVRRAALEVGGRLADGDHLAEAEDVFFLTGEELPVALRDGVTHRDTVKERKEARERTLANPGPASYGTDPGDPPDVTALPREAAMSMKAVLWATSNVFGEEQAPQEGDAADKGIRGHGASAGSYTGPARVIMNESEFDKIKAGDVLVCPITSPVWSVLFPSVGALVTDTGGILSHPAIIAREYGIPAVVSATNATSTLRDGQIVTVDGDAGVVTVED